MRAAIDRVTLGPHVPRGWWTRDGPVIAWVFEPLCAGGHMARAREIRDELGHPIARCVADMAIARHWPDPSQREVMIDGTLERLRELASHEHVMEAFDAALQWLAPLGRLRDVVTAAERLPSGSWLSFAELLQARGFHQALREQLTCERVAAEALELSASQIDPALWIDRLGEIPAAACWGQFWRGTSRFGRRAALVAGSYRLRVSCLEALPLAARAGGSLAALGLVQTLLDVGDWFP